MAAEDRTNRGHMPAYEGVKDTGIHQPAPVPADDEDRLKCLENLGLLDTDQELSFDRIVEAAAVFFKLPISAVSLVDKNRQWFKSQVGLGDCKETPRDQAFCSHTIKRNSCFVVNDATKDPRFKYNELVTGAPNIKFYAGAPLIYKNQDGEEHKLGSLCVIGQEPRKFSAEEELLLMTLARLVVREVEIRESLRATLRLEAEGEARKLNANYIGSVAHDIRTPLNSFTLGLQALATTGALNETQQDIVDMMSISAELMNLTVVKAVETSLDMNGAKLVAARTTVDLIKLLRKSERILMGYTHASQDVAYDFEVEPDVSEFVLSEQHWVWQMLMNLLSNARKFTTKGLISTKVSVVKNDGGPMLKFSVTDTGVGVRDADKGKLFRPFGQLQSYSGGTGLGLHSVQQKAQQLGGSCGIVDNKPHGSVFWFQVPYVPVEHDEESEGSVGNAQELGTREFSRDRRWQSDGTMKQMSRRVFEEGSFASLPSSDSPADSLRDGKPMSKVQQLLAQKLAANMLAPKGETPTAATEGKNLPRVLVVEDDVATAKLMRHGLQHRGFDVEHAGNGQLGLDAMQAKEFAFVLCDIMMPVMDGLECSERFREWELTSGRAKRQYICALSANTGELDQTKCAKAGMDSFFPKPVKIAALLTFLRDKCSLD